MNNAQKVIIGSAIVLGVGIFVFSDFSRRKSVLKAPDTSKGDVPFNPSTNFAGMAGVTIPRGYVPDPEMMLEVNPETFPNFAGSNEMLLAKKNYPFGENFARKRPNPVSYRPFYAKNRRKN
jgi:hypothetical protein